MMSRKKKSMISVLFCVSIALLAFSARNIPFFVYETPVLETTQEEFFSSVHLVRLLPFLYIAAAAGLIITACIFFRRKAASKYSRFRKGREKKCRKCAGQRVPGESRSRFMAVRWAVMILFSTVVMFGGIVSGITLSEISLPVLACPTNRQQLLESSCYFLAHLPELFEFLPVQAVILFFLSTVGFAILLGRMICGFLCPMGLIQDTMHILRQVSGEKGITMTESRYRVLLPVKWLLVLLMFGLVFLGGEFCSFCPALTTSPVFAGLQVSLYLSGFTMIAVLVGSFFKRRFWCNLCPLGYMIGLFHRISPFRITKDTTACTECGACYEACPMGIKAIYTERDRTDVTDTNCIMCGECVRRCPEDRALSMTFAGKRFYTSSRERVMSGYKEVRPEEEITL